MIANITYIPFLKLKQNEIMALKELTGSSKSNLLPFFDFPKGNHDNLEKFQTYVVAKAKQIRTHVGNDLQCYIDDYDVDEFLVDGQHSYNFLLDKFSDFSPIPVTGLDRTNEHKQSILSAVASGSITSKLFAFRVHFEDIQSYSAVEDEIIESVEDLIDNFEGMDLIIDLRVSLQYDVNSTVNSAIKFINCFVNQFHVNRVIITGSSISSIITNICKSKTQTTIARKEVEIFLKIQNKYTLDPRLIIGDYTVVSPEYSDLSIEPELMRTVMTSKLIYSHDHSHTIWRGASLRMEGNKQYNKHAAELIKLPIYRGPTFSWADGEFDNKSTLSDGFSASSVVKHSVNAHIEFMIRTGI